MAATPIKTTFEGDILMGYSAPLCPAELTTNQNSGLIASVPKINRNRNMVIANGSDFLDKIAVPGISQYAGVLNPAGTSKRDVPFLSVEKVRATKLNAAYQKWLDGIDAMFGTVDGIEGKNFKTIVAAKIDNYAKNFSAFTFPLTGSKNSGKGLSVWAPLHLLADYRSPGLVPAGFSVGVPYKICKAHMEASFRAGFAGVIIQACQLAIASGFDATTLTAVNAKLVIVMNSYNDLSLCNAFATPDADPTSSLVISKGAGADLVHLKSVIRLT